MKANSIVYHTQAKKSCQEGRYKTRILSGRWLMGSDKPDSAVSHPLLAYKLSDLENARFLGSMSELKNKELFHAQSVQDKRLPETLVMPPLTFIAGDNVHHRSSIQDNVATLLPSEHPLRGTLITDAMGLGSK